MGLRAVGHLLVRLGRGVGRDDPSGHRHRAPRRPEGHRRLPVDGGPVAGVVTAVPRTLLPAGRLRRLRRRGRQAGTAGLLRPPGEPARAHRPDPHQLPPRRPAPVDVEHGDVVQDRAGRPPQRARRPQLRSPALPDRDLRPVRPVCTSTTGAGATCRSSSRSPVDHRPRPPSTSPNSSGGSRERTSTPAATGRPSSCPTRCTSADSSFPDPAGCTRRRSSGPIAARPS